MMPNLDITYGELKRRLRMHQRQGGAGGMSIMNPSLTKDQALDILTKAIADRTDSDQVTPRDALIVRHVNKECGYA